jgi:hypothetical protein
MARQRDVVMSPPLLPLNPLAQRVPGFSLVRRTIWSISGIYRRLMAHYRN